MSKFSCIKETVIPAVIKREIVESTLRFSGDNSPAIRICNKEYNKKQLVSIITSNYLYDSVSLRELSDLVLQLADILDENNKDDTDGWIPFVSTKDTVCPVQPDTLVAIKTKSIPDGTFFTNAKYLTWTDLNSDSNVIAYKVK